MNTKAIEFKESLISTGLFKRTSNTQYRVKDCPICGDRKWHCYVKIDLSNDGPVVYHCFKCNNSGFINDKFLEYLGIDNVNIPQFSRFKKLDISESVSEKISGRTVDEKDDIKGVSEYIYDRIGHYPTLVDLQFFNYIGNPMQYTSDYLGTEGQNMIYNRYWFRMTNGNITGRWHNDDTHMRWLKYKSTKVRGSGLYKIDIPVDIYQPINVIIAEGIMDVIGLYYNYTELKNNIYIATLGKDYEKGIRHILGRGIFGDNVVIKIFKDSDVKSIYIDHNLKRLFKRVDIYENLKGKDYGVQREMLDVHKVIRP